MIHEDTSQTVAWPVYDNPCLTAPRHRFCNSFRDQRPLDDRISAQRIGAVSQIVINFRRCAGVNGQTPAFEERSPTPLNKAKFDLQLAAPYCENLSVSTMSLLRSMHPPHIVRDGIPALHMQGYM